MVTNTTFRMAPWADVLFGFDAKWWRTYESEVRAQFPGRKIAGTQIATRYGAESPYVDGRPWFSLYRNSGCCAGAIAIASGATRIVLLGYDAGFSGGRKHWHADHPNGLENAASIMHWPRLFGLLAKSARRSGVEVVNASRQTLLTCFPRAQLEAVL